MKELLIKLIESLRELLKDEESTDTLVLVASFFESGYKVCNSELDRRKRLDEILREIKN